MDTGKGEFAIVDEENEGIRQQMMETLERQHPNHGGWFRVGEEIEIKGSRFRVKAVKPKELRLKLLPKQ